MYDFKIVAYNIGSASAKRLAETLCSETTVFNNQLSPKRFSPESLFAKKLRKGELSVPNKPTVIVSWGNTGLIKPKDTKNILFLNSVDTSPYTDKLKFFKKFSCGYTPVAYYNYDAAGSILAMHPSNHKGPILVERNILSGHSGEGIRLLKKGDSPNPAARLWTAYQKKTREFRCHFFKLGSRLYYHWQEKKLKKAAVEAEPVKVSRFQIRNLDNGWVYTTKDLLVPGRVKAAVEHIVSNSNNTLNFGAVDVIYQHQTGNAYILEINSAPGLEGSTLEFYKTMILLAMTQHNWGSGLSQYKFNPTATGTVTAMEAVAPVVSENVELEEEEPQEEELWLDEAPELDDNF